MVLPAVICSFLLFLNVNASSEISEITQISSKINNLDDQLKSLGQLVVLGNSSLEDAHIIFLPEVHDDPESLFIQLLLVAREQQGNKPFIILDESLASMKKSVWDIFSEKTLEIIAAKQQRHNGISYVPHQFEAALQKLAKQFQNMHGSLHFLDELQIWALTNFKNIATPFYGWDLRGKSSLMERNLTMVESLKKALTKNNRILVMAGARHIPQLEFLVSQKLLCKDSQSADIKEYFSRVEEKLKTNPNLNFGIGTTAPIFSFLSNKRYAVVFHKDLYQELDKIIRQFKSRNSADSCMQL